MLGLSIWLYFLYFMYFSLANASFGIFNCHKEVGTEIMYAKHTMAPLF